MLPALEGRALALKVLSGADAVALAVDAATPELLAEEVAGEITDRR